MTVNLSNSFLEIGSEKLERIGNDCKIKSFKFVGIHLYEFLSWEYHINHVKSKLSSANYIINSTKNILSLKIRMTLYNSLFKSHLIYGILAWGMAPKKSLKQISQLQKRCVRNVANKDFRSHTNPIFSSLKILKFEDLCKYESLVYMHKYAFARLPPSLLDMFTPLKTNSRNGKYLIKKYKGMFFEKFPSVFLPKLWNTHSDIIKNILKLTQVKNKIKSEMINNYYFYKDHCNYTQCPDCIK